MGAIMTKRGSAFSGKLMTAMICMEVMISMIKMMFLRPVDVLALPVSLLQFPQSAQHGSAALNGKH